MEVSNNQKGYTLIELLVSFAIFAVLLLGLLAGLIAAYNISTKNLIRDEAIKIAQEYIEEKRGTAFDNINSESRTITRQIRNTNVQFTINSNVSTELANEVKRLTVTVSWTYQGKTYRYNIETLVRKE